MLFLKNFRVFMAIGCGAFMGIILLMIIFCFPKCSGRFEHGGHMIPFFLKYMDIFFCDRFLRFIGIKNAGTVLRSYIRSLAIGLGEIVRFKE